MAPQKENIRLKSRERVRYHLRIFVPIVVEMYRLFGIIKKYQILLNSPRLLFRTRKNWIAYLIAFRLYENYRSGNISANNIRDYIEGIRKYDVELAEAINKLLPVAESESNIFDDLIRAYSQGKEFFVRYIATYAQELITRAKSIKDPKLSQRLVRFFSSISGHEAEYLMRYRNDAEAWTNIRYSLNYRIDFFLRRLNLYIKGGVEDNIIYMGLYKDFRDVPLTKTMFENNRVRNLWRFSEQLRYLNFLIELCRKSETSGEWEGFWGKNGFWSKRGKGKKGKNFDKYAEQFETKYGNKDFADTLRAQKWKIGENPEGWGGLWEGDRLVKPGFLHQLQARLQHPSYQMQKIVIPASTALSQIFKKREEGLLKAREKSVNELIETLMLLSGLGIDRNKVIVKFRRLLNKKKWRLLRELENETNELISKISDPFSDCDSFMNGQKTAMTKVNLEYREARIRRLDSLANQSIRYVITQLIKGDFLEDVLALVFTDGSSSSAQLAFLQMTQLMRFDHLTEEDFQQMEKLIPSSKNVVIKLRNVVYGYIKGVLDRKYLIKIEDINRLRIDVDSIKAENFKVKPKDVFSISLQAEVIPKAA